MDGNTNIQPYLEMIKVALQESKIVTFVYIAHHGNKSERTVEPYQLVWKGSHWYLYGYCHNRNDVRLFRLSRMSTLQIAKETFLPREFQKPQLDFDDTLTTLQTEIKIRIHKSIMDRVLDYCAYDKFSPDGDEHYIVHFPFVENAYHYDILLSFGNRCECLEPFAVREQMKKKLHELFSLYECTY